MIRPEHRLALLMHGYSRQRHGKMGFALLRYRPSQVVAVIDRTAVGESVRDVTGIHHPAPIVASVSEAMALGADVLVVAVATTGGVLPDDFRAELAEGLRAGINVVYPLHGHLSADPELGPLVQPGCWIWDIRVEPEGLMPGTGLAAALPGRRVLTVGTDMAIGKMTASLECDSTSRSRGLRSKFLASGQIGIALDAEGDGVPLDAVRIDFASGSIEQLVLRHAHGHELLWIEGQGSLLHPSSTAWLPLIRGSCPTHLILCTRAGQRHVDRFPQLTIPPLPEVIRVYEAVAAIAGGPAARVAGISVNCGRLSDAAARAAVDEAAAESGLPATDVLRFGAGALVDAVMS